MKKINCLILLILCFSLIGCVGRTVKREKTYMDPETLQEVTIVETTEGSWWASENQSNLLDFESKRVEKSAEVSLRQLDQLERNAIRRSQLPLSPDARAYADALDMVVTANVKTSVQASGIAMPKNMADVMQSNIIPLSYMAIGLTSAMFDLDIGGPFGGGGAEDSAYFDNIEVGGDFYVSSERNDQRYLEEGSALDESKVVDMSETEEVNEGNSSNSGEGSANSSNDADEDIGIF